MAERTIRITLASPAVNAWSETFIAAHIERLQKVDLLVSGGNPPRHASRGAQFARSSTVGVWMDRAIARFHAGVPQ